MGSLISRLAIIEPFLKAVFPRYCVRCREEGSLWCKSCDQTFFLEPPIPVCPFCHFSGSLRTCKECRQETYLDGVCAVSSYADPVMRRAVQVWKYDGDRSIEQVLQKWIKQTVPAISLLDLQTVIPVPLHSRRRRYRGFDQAVGIAQMVSHASKIPFRQLIYRDKLGFSQARSTRKRRLLGQMDGVFKLAFVPPKRVLLCDDVFTTGATMDAAAKVLKEGGAKEVWGFVLAQGNPVSTP